MNTQPPPARLLLIRHGQAGGHDTLYGPTTSLTTTGRLQAERIVQSLRDASLRHIYVSPFTRAQQTAQPSITGTGLPCQTDDRLREFHLGDEQTSTIHELVNNRSYLATWRAHHGPEAGETLGEFQGRVSDALDEIATRHDGEAVALFTHAGTIAAAMRWAHGLTPQDDWHTDVEVSNASITEIHHWHRGRHPEGAPFAFAIARLNDVSHLEPELVTDY